jgi:hypothetical protein
MPPNCVVLKLSEETHVSYGANGVERKLIVHRQPSGEEIARDLGFRFIDPLKKDFCAFLCEKFWRESEPMRFSIARERNVRRRVERHLRAFNQRIMRPAR